MTEVKTPTILKWSLFSVLIGVLISGCTGKTWDYVALGDSYPAGFGVDKSYVEYYAEFIQQDLDVDVEIHDFSRSGQSASLLLNSLREKEEIRDAIKDAEVVTIYTGWNDVWLQYDKFRNESCGGEDNLDCIREEVGKLNKDIDAILDEILSLTNTQDTLIRIADTNIPFINSWKYNGWFDTLQGPCFEEWRDHLVEASMERGITVVYSYPAMNGPNGDQPLDKEIMQDDGTHLNEEGHKLLARLHREVGYDFAP